MARGSNTTGQAILSDRGRVIAGRVAEWRCPCCLRKMDRSACKRRQIQADHWLPCAAGGAAIIEGNLVAICGSCNATKRAETDAAIWIPMALRKARPSLTNRGAARMVPVVLARIEAAREAMTAALVAEGIWAAEIVDRNRAALAALIGG